MAHSRYLQEMTRLLRVERQLSVDALAKRLALPRSTIYYWVRDLPLRESHRDGVAPSEPADQHDAVEQEALEREALLQRRARAYEEALRSYDDLAAQPTFGDFLSVYIAAGYKRDRSKVALANSDPAVVRLAHRWIWRLTDKSPSLAVHCPAGQSVAELRRFWSETVGEDARAILPARGDGRELLAQWSARPVHGVLTVAVDDILLRARMQAWMCRMRESWR